jgi:TRAP-type C4-dicarboxylate transport system substrate-binding protein
MIPFSAIFCRRLLLVLAAVGLNGVCATAEPLKLRVVGGFASVSQFKQLEEPFWTKEIGHLTSGRVSAKIHAFDRSGLRAQDMLQLVRLGVVPLGSALVTLAAGDEPELEAMDLPGLNPDIASLRQHVGAYRSHLKTLLKERYDLELLGVYAYPAQVLFCTEEFQGLQSLAGRRVRTSSVGQSNLMEALGATPVVLPFGDIVPSINRGIVDCAITGTLSGRQIGLSEATSQIHAMAISWGLSIFIANAAVWRSIPEDLRDTLGVAVAALEQRIWQAAERDTQLGYDCNTGVVVCDDGKGGRMTLVQPSQTDRERMRQALSDIVIPRWVDRCGPDCASVWNRTLGGLRGSMISPASDETLEAVAGRRQR